MVNNLDPNSNILKILLNSTYGFTPKGNILFDDILKARKQFYRVKKRKEKIIRINHGG